MSGILLDNKSEMMWGKASVAQLGVIVWRGPKKFMGNLIQMAKLKGMIGTQNLPRREQECYLGLNVLSEFLLS